MKSKLLIIALLISAICAAQSVPNNSTFKLTDVTAVTGGTSLSAAFANSTDSYFDSNYKGSKDRLSNFRNYGPHNAGCTLPVFGSMAWSYDDVTSSTILVTPNLLANGTCTVTERGAVASTSANPTVANIKVSNGSGTGQYSIQFTGLSANTTYYVRPYYIANSTAYYGTSLEVAITTNP